MSHFFPPSHAVSCNNARLFVATLPAIYLTIVYIAISRTPGVITPLLKQTLFINTVRVQSYDLLRNAFIPIACV